MPYDSIRELPDSVRDHLPRHAQEIYKSTYNNAWEEYDHNEQRAHRVAWAAVKKSYIKDDESGQWVEKDK
jgi:cation transport regulator